MIRQLRARVNGTHLNKAELKYIIEYIVDYFLQYANNGLQFYLVDRSGEFTGLNIRDPELLSDSEFISDIRETMIKCLSVVFGARTVMVTVAQHSSPSVVRVFDLFPDMMSDHLEFIQERPITDHDYQMFDLDSDQTVYHAALNITDLVDTYRREHS